MEILPEEGGEGKGKGKQDDKGGNKNKSQQKAMRIQKAVFATQKDEQGAEQPV